MSGSGGLPHVVPISTVLPISSTEQAVMRAWVDNNADRVRYDHSRGKWLIWDQHFWRLDQRKRAFWSAIEFCHRLNKSKAERAAFANAVELLARAHPAVATMSKDWNPDPTLVACPTGVIELATGRLRPGHPSDMIDRSLSVSPDNGMDAPVLFDFLQQMWPQDGVIDCLQRWFGYCLSGLISEHKFLFMHGTGANGKGTLLNLAASIWDDYCVTASIDVFLESHVDRHPTEIAKLHGAHLVMVHETREGRRWDEAKIKSLTGGDRVTARFMHKDEFEFVPRFKPVFAGNHEPHLRSVDEAIRRRLVILPCTITIPSEDRDPKLGDKLSAVAPRFLAWAIDGFQQWNRIGLRPPPSMLSATEDYLAHQDDLQLWIDERCGCYPGAGPTLAIALFRDWETWKLARGDRPGSQTSFNARLRDKGFPRRRPNTGVEFDNIRLL